MQFTDLVLHRSTCEREVVDPRTLLRLTGIAAVGAAIVNGIIYEIAQSAGAISADVQMMGSSSLDLAQVIVASIGGVVLAALTLLLIGRFKDRPSRLYERVAVTAFVVSLLTPVSLHGITFAMAIVLMSMHLVAFAFSFVVLPRAIRPDYVHP